MDILRGGILLGGGSGDLGTAGQIQGVGVGEAGDEAVLLQKGLLELVHTVADVRGQAVVFHAHGSGGAHGLAAHGAGAHDPGGCHGQLGGGEAAAAQHQVGDVGGVVAAVGDGVEAGEVMDEGGSNILVLQAPGSMVVHRPAAVSHGVGEDPVGQDIVFVEDIAAHEPPALPDTGEHTHPLQVIVLRAVVARVLQVVPHAVDTAHQLVSQLFVFLDDVLFVTGQLDPPVAIVQAEGVEGLLAVGAGGAGVVHIAVGGIGVIVPGGLYIAVAAVFQVLLGELPCPLGGLKLHRMAPVYGLEQQGVAHADVVGYLGSVRLVVGVLALAADMVLRTRHVAHGAVAGAVGENLGFDGPVDLRGGLVAVNLGDASVLHIHIVDGSVQKEGQVFLGVDLVQQHGVPDGEIMVVVAVLVVQLQLQQDAGFLAVLLDHVLRRAAHMHPDFGAGVAAQHRPVLDKRGPGTLAGTGKGSADAGHAAADDDHIKACCLFFSANTHNTSS